MYTVLLVIGSILFIVLTTVRFHLHPFLALLLAAFLFGFFSGMPLVEIINAINQGFGSTLEKIGIVIIAGIIIGAFLENSGGAYALADKILKWIGRKRVHEAMSIIGFFVSIPVFGDSGFIILASLNKALSKEARVSLAGTAVALSLGLTASHTMVPPTPGPIAAAGIIGADLGIVILLGLFVSACALITSMIFAKKFAGKIYIDPDPELSDDDIVKKLEKAPSATISFLPIFIPLLLIVLRSFAEYPTHPFGEGQIKELFSFIGNPICALFIGIFLSLFLPKQLDMKMLGVNGWVGDALKSGAVIILITGAGGAFGKILQLSDIGEILGGLAQNSALGLWLPFLIAAGIKSAQGSSTVALITTASLLSPLVSELGMDTEIRSAMMVIAIGAGSAVVSHVNDSFFWVVTQMSNMNVKQGYQLQSVGTLILGLTAMIILSILSFIF